MAAHERQAAALRERAQFKQRLKEVTIERDAARKSTSDLVKRLAAAEEARGHLEGDVETFQQGLAQILWEGGLHSAFTLRFAPEELQHQPQVPPPTPPVASAPTAAPTSDEHASVESARTSTPRVDEPAATPAPGNETPSV